MFTKFIKMELKPFLRIDEHLTIHLARPELAEPIFMVVDTERAYLREWFPWVDSTNKVEHTQSFIKESMAHNTSGTRLTTFIMQDDEIAGSIGVVKFNRDNRSCEIGYWLRQQLQGQGIMTKACACFITHLFKARNLNRIEILIARDNTRSKGIPERLGFTLEGTLRQGLFMYGKYFDLELYSLLREEWITRKENVPSLS